MLARRPLIPSNTCAASIASHQDGLVFQHPETVLANTEGGVGIAISDCALSASQAWKALETIQSRGKAGGTANQKDSS